MGKRTVAAIGVLAICGLGVFTLPATAAGFKPGKWQFTTTMSGMPMPKLPPGVHLPANVHIGGNSTTYTTCLTSDHPVPQNHQSDCKVSSMHHSGNTVRWSVVCHTGGGETHGMGRATYSGNSMHGMMTIDSNADGHAMHMTGRTTGRYLGPCG